MAQIDTGEDVLATLFNSTRMQSHWGKSTYILYTNELLRGQSIHWNPWESFGDKFGPSSGSNKSVKEPIMWDKRLWVQCPVVHTKSSVLPRSEHRCSKLGYRGCEGMGGHHDVTICSIIQKLGQVRPETVGP